MFGFIHGALLFLAIGLFLGSVAGRAAAGAIAGACVGALAAGLYYLLSPMLGFSAMVVAWMAVWLGLAAIYGRLKAQRIDAGHRHDIRVNTVPSPAEAALAAVASGLAFYLDLRDLAALQSRRDGITRSTSQHGRWLTSRDSRRSC